MQNITGPIYTAWDLRETAREAVLDGSLDPEFLLHCTEALDRNDSEQLAYLRLVTTVNLMFRVFGDDYLRDLGLDPRDIVY